MPEVREFALPDLGEGLTEATVVRWLVAVGDVVAIDQAVVEVETAKAMVEVPCPYAGVVTAQYAEEGTELPVGSPLVTVASPAPSRPGTDSPDTAYTADTAGSPDTAGFPDAADTTATTSVDTSVNTSVNTSVDASVSAAESGGGAVAGGTAQAPPAVAPAASGEGGPAAAGAATAGAAAAGVPEPVERGGRSVPATGVPEAEHVGGSGNVLVGYGTQPTPGVRRRTRRGKNKRGSLVSTRVYRAFFCAFGALRMTGYDSNMTLPKY